MFHYTCKSYDGTTAILLGNGFRQDRGKADIEVGEGEVMELNPNGGTAIIKVLFDRHNKPMRKPLQKRLHVGWLKLISRGYSALN